MCALYFDLQTIGGAAWYDDAQSHKVATAFKLFATHTNIHSCTFHLKQFNADLALSVTMTAISTLMSVILMPANLLLYCNASYDADVVQSIDFNSLFIALTVVISAIGFGLFASAKVHSYRFNIFANRVSSLLEMNDVLLHCNANTSSLLFGNTKYSLETTQEYH